MLIVGGVLRESSELGEEGLIGVSLDFWREVGFGMFTCCIGHLLSSLCVIDELIEFFDEAVFIAVRDEEAGLVVDECFSRTPGIVADDGEAGHLGFDEEVG